jgi:hypothetical protein
MEKLINSTELLLTKLRFNRDEAKSIGNSSVVNYLNGKIDAYEDMLNQIKKLNI